MLTLVALTRTVPMSALVKTISKEMESIAKVSYTGTTIYLLAARYILFIRGKFHHFKTQSFHQEKHSHVRML